MSNKSQECGESYVPRSKPHELGIGIDRPVRKVALRELAASSKVTFHPRLKDRKALDGLPEHIDDDATPLIPINIAAILK